MVEPYDSWRKDGTEIELFGHRDEWYEVVKMMLAGCGVNKILHNTLSKGWGWAIPTSTLCIRWLFKLLSNSVEADNKRREVSLFRKRTDQNSVCVYCKLCSALCKWGHSWLDKPFILDTMTRWQSNLCQIPRKLISWHFYNNFLKFTKHVVFSCVPILVYLRTVESNSGFNPVRYTQTAEQCSIVTLCAFKKCHLVNQTRTIFD